VTNKERADLCEAFNKPVMDAFNSALISQEIALKELQQNSRITNVFTNITDEFVEKADKQVSQPGEFGGPFEHTKEDVGRDGDDSLGATDSSYSEPGAATADDFALGSVDAMKRYHGLDIVVETPRGSGREGTWWRSTMPADYGYIKGFKGADEDDIDCYIGSNPAAMVAYVVDQNRIGSNKFDEHKCFLGFSSLEDAQTCYMRGHTDGAEIFRGIAALPMTDFKHWLKHGNHRKPITDSYRDMRMAPHAE
jgi:hypothetical protein